MHTVMATEFSCELNRLACTPTNSWSRVAELGWLGSLLSFSPVRKLPQPAAPRATPRETATTLIERIMSRSPRALAVQGDGEHERAALGIAEILGPLNCVGGPAAARLGVEARPLGPGVQVSAGHPGVDAPEAERALHPRRVQRVGDRYLAQLDVAIVVETRLVVVRERARGEVSVVPVLADRNRQSGPRTGDRPVVPPTGAERPHAQWVIGVRHAPRRRADGPMLGVLVRPVAPQRSLRAVGDDAAVPDVEQPGELQLAVAQRRPHAARPARVRVGDDSRFGIPQGKAVGGDVERALRRPGTRRGEAGDEGRVADAATEESQAAVDADLLARPCHPVTKEAGLRAAQRERVATV